MDRRSFSRMLPRSVRWGCRRNSLRWVCPGLAASTIAYSWASSALAAAAKKTCARCCTTRVEIVGVADVYEPRFAQADAVAGRPVFHTADYRELIARPDVDAFLIASPLACHREHLLAVLATGKPVYSEKALGFTVDDCQALVHAARASKSLLQAGAPVPLRILDPCLDRPHPQRRHRRAHARLRLLASQQRLAQARALARPWRQARAPH